MLHAISLAFTTAILWSHTHISIRVLGESQRKSTQKPRQLSQQNKKTTKVQSKVSKSKKKYGERTPVSKKHAITPKRFFKVSLEKHHAEKQSTSAVENYSQYKPGDHLFTLESVNTEQIFQFSDEENSWQDPDENDDISADDDDDDGEVFTLTTDFLPDWGKENNPSVANCGPVAGPSTSVVALSQGKADTSLQPSSFDIMTLLQQQQAMLQQMIDQQTAFSSKIDETETRITAVERWIKESSSSSSSSSTPKQTKQRILRDLSVSLFSEIFCLFFVCFVLYFTEQSNSCI